MTQPSPARRPPHWGRRHGYALSIPCRRRQVAPKVFTISPLDGSGSLPRPWSGRDRRREAGGSLNGEASIRACCSLGFQRRLLLALLVGLAGLLQRRGRNVVRFHTGDQIFGARRPPGELGGRLSARSPALLPLRPATSAGCRPAPTALVRSAGPTCPVAGQIQLSRDRLAQPHQVTAGRPQAPRFRPHLQARLRPAVMEADRLQACPGCTSGAGGVRWPIRAGTGISLTTFASFSASGGSPSLPVSVSRRLLGVGERGVRSLDPRWRPAGAAFSRPIGADRVDFLLDRRALGGREADIVSSTDSIRLAAEFPRPASTLAVVARDVQQRTQTRNGEMPAQAATVLWSKGRVRRQIVPRAGEMIRRNRH